MASPRERLVTLLVVAIGTFMGALDASIVNVSIPAIMESYHAGIDSVEWVISAYMIAFAALMPLSAWVRERVGNVPLYCGSLALFTLASALCGYAPNLETLIAARILQALGGGAINPTGMAMLASVYPPEERGRALGWWGMVAVVGPALGPTLGGVLTETLGWQWIFLVNVPIGIPLVLVGLKMLPRQAKPAGAQESFQWWSFATLVTAITSLLYATSRLPRAGFGERDVEIATALALVAGSLFILNWRQTGRAILDLRLLKIDGYWRATAITVARSMALFGTTLLVPLYLQGPRGLGETESGFVLGPGALAIGLMMPVAGRLIPRFGTRKLAIGGIVLLAIYCLLCCLWTTATPVWLLTATLIVRGLGIGLLVTPISTLAINSVGESRVGMASSMLNLTQQMAGALGVALFSGLYDFFLAGSAASPAMVAAFACACFVAAGITLATVPVALGLPR